MSYNMGMSTQLKTLRDQLPIPGWRWRTAYEGSLLPSEMGTNHLFHTLRMIWNNFMPAHMRVGKVKLYYFDSGFYSPHYLRTAVQQIGAELFRRKDILPEHKRQLEEMAYWFAYAEFNEVDEPQLTGPKKVLTHG